MAGSWRTTARMLATAAAASAVSKAADSVRRLLEEASKSPEIDGPVSQPAPLRLVEPAPTQIAPVPPTPVPTVAAHAEVPHEFGPTPVLPPSRGIGFHHPPRTTASVPDLELVVAPPVELHTTAPEVPPAKAPEKSKKRAKKDTQKVKTAVPEPTAERTKERGKHRRDRSAISGTVTSSRGRGLRGIEVSVVNADEAIVATATSGTSGTYIVEGLPAGTYRVTGTDPDDDFVPGWIGGASFSKASRIKLKDGSTRRKANIRLTANADLDVKVDRRKKSTHLGIRVTDRGTGIAASGRVNVSNKLFGVELPLHDGKADVTLFGSTDGSTKPPKKVDIAYQGDKHTAPTSQSTKLR